MNAAEPVWVPDVRHARTLVIEALLCDAPAERYLQAQYAVALAADAAVLARTGRRIPVDLGDPWPLLASTVPALGEWAAYFAATQSRRRSIAAGRLQVSDREADDLLRDADGFCEAVIDWAQRFEGGKGFDAGQGRSAG
ncbi:SAV_6107 family HEPN domain-containing protein [Propionibacteriaceae bacterium G1746]|uniref:SAV_6107 family HEPN domain-containing protein n=1 Tax=Aestuariimicrobium sp. G57 TaxID=3418485 RepID=UPI003C1E3EC8